jgi:hypothetical protein
MPLFLQICCTYSLIVFHHLAKATPYEIGGLVFGYFEFFASPSDYIATREGGRKLDFHVAH